MDDQVIDWEGWATDDLGHHVHILCSSCPAGEAAAQVIARVLAKYGVRTHLTSWRFWLQPSPPRDTGPAVHFRADENGTPVFGI